jgi:hypothetical protein
MSEGATAIIRGRRTHLFTDPINLIILVQNREVNVIVALGFEALFTRVCSAASRR